MQFETGDVIVLTDHRPSRKWWKGFVCSTKVNSSLLTAAPPADGDDWDQIAFEIRSLPHNFVRLEPAAGVFPVTVQYPLPSAGGASESSNEGGGGGAVSQTKQNQSD